MMKYSHWLRKKSALLKPYSIISLLFLLSACTGQDGQYMQAKNSSRIVYSLEFDNGRVDITLSDLEVVAQRSLGKDYHGLDDSLKVQLQQSLISTIAMVNMAQSMDADLVLHQEINEKVEAYEQELWVKEYLKKHAIPQPVSRGQVEKYYREHLSEFGASEKTQVAQISCKYINPNDVTQCSQLLSSATSTEWLEYAKKNDQLEYKKFTTNTDLLEDDMAKVIDDTMVKSTSAIKKVKNELYRIHVLSRSVLAARPLQSVQNEIRQKLAPVQLKRAIKVAAKQARNNIIITPSTF